MTEQLSWMGHAKTYDQCDSCGIWKVLIWLRMCGACSIEHKRRTAEAVSLWKRELKDLQYEQKGEDVFRSMRQSSKQSEANHSGAGGAL